MATAQAAALKQIGITIRPKPKTVLDRPAVRAPLCEPGCIDPQMLFVRVLTAFAVAGAAYQYGEDLRPNILQAILAAEEVAAGATISNETTLAEGNYIRNIVCHDGNSGMGATSFFTLDSIQINGWEGIRNGPVPLSIVAGYRQDNQRFRPLTGRIWRSAVPIFASVTNPTAAPLFFGGLAVECVNNECTPATSRSQPTYGFKTLLDGKLWAMQLLRVLGVAC